MKNTILLLFGLFISCCIMAQTEVGIRAIKIEWVNNLPGNFSFKNKWSYDESIYKNEWGQLVCDGICPEEIDNMRDDNGKIYPDSIKSYYKYVDTTHRYHTISCKSNAPEFAGVDFIEATQKENGMLVCYTLMNVATHSGLELKILNGNCYVIMEWHSVTNEFVKTYPVTTGYMKVDKTYWEKGILKASFEFKFNDGTGAGNNLSWNGRIYTKIGK